MAEMTAKQQAFCDEYLIDLNATQAAIRAGYSKKTAVQTASRLLTNVKVQEYLQEKQKKREQRTEITQDMVLRELALIAFSNAADYTKVVEKEFTQLVQGVETPILDTEGKPVKYKTVEPILTDELTEDQKKALAVIKKGRDGFEVKPYDKLRALEMLGRHLGMWDKKPENPDENNKDDGFLEALQSECENVWQE